MDEEKQINSSAEVGSHDDVKVAVGWKGDDDPCHPHNWSKFRKWFIISLTSLACFNSAIVSTIFAPGVPDVLNEFNSSDDALASFMVTVYLIGSVIGPLILPPISECYGRLLITHISNIGFFFSSILCASAVNMPMLIVARFLMGIAASIPSTVGGGIIADLMVVEERGTALTIWTIGNSLAHEVMQGLFSEDT
ncbi:hypothetical protein EYZ11_000962 [Aspergillus tanneri]|uniref:Major facilitator superfamily (MFS) profile domain-containing protein n=1 Tax=Aspergillus tanneri TaxID=1220188 RepID=A0A4S3JW17_9EURO|nr:hypothetical protein EYZ11_000962 [Aspergillus tanneri]